MKRRQRDSGVQKNSGRRLRGRSVMTPAAIRENARAVAQDIPGMVLVMNTTAGVVFANPRFLSALGTTLSAVQGNRWHSLLHEENRGSAVALVAAAVRARQPFAFESRCRHSHEEFRRLAFAGAPHVHGGRFAGYLCTVTDVTPRHASERAAALAAASLQALVVATDDVCVGIGREEEIVCWNSAAEQFTAVPVTEAIGRQLETVFSPETVSRMRAVLRRTDSDNGPLPLESITFRMRPDRPLSCRLVTSGEISMLVAAREAPRTRRPAGEPDTAAGTPEGRATQDEVEDLMVVQDPEGRYLYSSGMLKPGMQGERLYGRTPAELFDKEEAERILSSIRAVVETGRGFTQERSIESNGQTLVIADQFFPMDDGNRSVAAVATVSRDVTKRKQSGQRQRETAERYMRFVENSNEGIWRIEVAQPVPCDLPEDEQVQRIFDSAYVAECNRSLARLFGFRNPEDIIGASLKALSRRGVSLTTRALAEFVRGGYTLTNWEDQLAVPAEETRYVLHNVVGTVENNTLTRAWGSVSDISERKAAERMMRLLAQTITSTRDCVSITDLNDRILFVNDAFLSSYGYREEDLLGADYAIVRAPSVSGEDVSAIREQTLANGWYGEVMSRRADGSLFPVELWTSVVRNDEDEPVAMVGVARDITARRAAEEELRASLREKEVLLKEIHHRVKNNLQVISSLLSLQSEYLNDEAMIRVFKESQNRVKSMALIHEKLYQSRNLAEIDFGDYLRELTSHLFRSYGIDAHGVTLKVDAEAILLAVDRAIPCGIIVNELVTNALKYAFPNREEGRITIALHQVAGNRIRMGVSDSGVGLPEHLDLETTDSLGLTLVRMLTEQVQGELSVKTAGPGTEFIVTFRK